MEKCPASPGPLKGGVGGRQTGNAVITLSGSSSQIALALREPLHRQQGNGFPPLLWRLPPVAVVSPGTQSEITESDVGTLEQRDPLQTGTNRDFYSTEKHMSTFRDPNPTLTLTPILTLILTPILTLTCISYTPLNGWIKQAVNFKG